MNLRKKHFELALSQAILAMREQELKIRPDFRSTARDQIEQAYESLERGEKVHIVYEPEQDEIAWV